MNNLNERILDEAEVLKDQDLPRGILARVRRKICEIGVKNANKRVYSRDVWERVLADEEFQRKLKNRQILGDCEHPEYTQAKLSPESTSHVISNMWIDEKTNSVKADFDILKSTAGQFIHCLLEAGVKVGASTRAEGELEEAIDEAGEKYSRVKPESYRFVTVDHTQDPSAGNTEPESIITAVRKGYESKEIGKELACALLEMAGSENAKKLEEAIKADKQHESCKCSIDSKHCKDCKRFDATKATHESKTHDRYEALKTEIDTLYKQMEAETDPVKKREIELKREELRQEKMDIEDHWKELGRESVVEGKKVDAFKKWLQDEHKMDRNAFDDLSEEEQKKLMADFEKTQESVDEALKMACLSCGKFLSKDTVRSTKDGRLYCPECFKDAPAEDEDAIEEKTVRGSSFDYDAIETKMAKHGFSHLAGQFEDFERSSYFKSPKSDDDYVSQFLSYMRDLQTGQLEEKIVKVGDKWQVQSSKGKNMGTYKTKDQAKKRLKQVEHFKSVKESNTPVMSTDAARILLGKILDYLLIADDPAYNKIVGFRKQIEKLPVSADKENLIKWFNSEFRPDWNPKLGGTEKTAWDYYDKFDESKLAESEEIYCPNCDKMIKKTVKNKEGHISCPECQHDFELDESKVNEVHFTDLDSILSKGKDLTTEELIAAVKLSITSEFDATELYKKIAAATDNAMAKKVMQSVADEESVHAGEFRKLLATLDPKEEDLQKKGEQEAAKESRKLKLKESLLKVGDKVKYQGKEHTVKAIDLEDYLVELDLGDGKSVTVTPEEIEDFMTTNETRMGREITFNFTKDKLGNIDAALVAVRKFLLTQEPTVAISSVSKSADGFSVTIPSGVGMSAEDIKALLNPVVKDFGAFVGELWEAKIIEAYKKMAIGDEAEIPTGNAQLVYYVEGTVGEKFRVDREGTMVPPGEYEIISKDTDTGHSGPWGTFSYLKVRKIAESKIEEQDNKTIKQKFLLGFAQAAGIPVADAAAAWEKYKKGISQEDEDDVVSGGYESGKVEGDNYKSLQKHPKQDQSPSRKADDAPNYEKDNKESKVADKGPAAFEKELVETTNVIKFEKLDPYTAQQEGFDEKTSAYVSVPTIAITDSATIGADYVSFTLSKGHVQASHTDGITMRYSVSDEEIIRKLESGLKLKMTLDELKDLGFRVRSSERAGVAESAPVRKKKDPYMPSSGCDYCGKDDTKFAGKHGDYCSMECLKADEEAHKSEKPVVRKLKVSGNSNEAVLKSKLDVAADEYAKLESRLKEVTENYANDAVAYTGELSRKCAEVAKLQEAGAVPAQRSREAAMLDAKLHAASDEYSKLEARLKNLEECYASDIMDMTAKILDAREEHSHISAKLSKAQTELSEMVQTLRNTEKESLRVIQELKQSHERKLSTLEESKKKELSKMADAHQSELDALVAEHKKQMLHKYVECRIRFSGLSLSESVRALLEQCNTEEKVESVLEQYRRMIREGVHFTAASLTVIDGKAQPKSALQERFETAASAMIGTRK